MESAEYTFSQFLDQHSGQLNASCVPPELWHELYKKLIAQKFDAGEYFRIICEQSDDGEKTMSVLAMEDLHNADENNIFLIDHFFTFESDKARKILESSSELVEKLAELFGIDELNDEANETAEKIITSDEHEKKIYAEKQASIEKGELPRHESVDARLSSYSVEDSENAKVEKVLKELWKHALTYSVSFGEGGSQKKVLWYVMDEFGARLRHSSMPNVRVVPIMFLPQGCAYNVMFLTKPVSTDEELVRDFAENVLTAKNPEWRKYLELPWMDCDFSMESSRPPPSDDTFFSSGRVPDELASSADQETSQSAILASLAVLKSRKLRIFADDDQLVKYLKRDYELVDDWKKADVIWLMKHFHDFRDLCESNPCGMINQFPYESCLTVKDLMAACAMRDPVKNDWYQLTYNLNTQLPQFVACYQQKAISGKEPNVWIVKPWNLARGMEMCVTDDLNKIIRLVETGPKIVCQYIDRPMLFPRPDTGSLVKFDLRYIVFVNSYRPVTAYVYNKFWIRFAINDFSMSDFDDVETHFTVFNYVEDASKVLQMKCEKFVESVEQAYPKVKWDDVQAKINSTIRKALEVTSQNDPPSGVASNIQSRAMYGVDIMLQYDKNDEIKPTLLECNFMPDCTRACQYYPDFADTVFDTLFLDDIDPTKVTPI